MALLAARERDELQETIDEIDAGIQKAREDRALSTLLELHETAVDVALRLALDDARQAGQSSKAAEQQAQQNDAVRDRKKRLVEACNYAATQLLQQDMLDASLALLKRAEFVATSLNSAQARCVTLNNQACYYRKIGKLRTAQKLLSEALAVETRLASKALRSQEESENPAEALIKTTAPTLDVAQTHLNLTATLSQLGKHEEAIPHAQSALIRALEAVSCDPTHARRILAGGAQDEDADKDEEQKKKEEEEAARLKENVSVLCIAYHNLAVEHEHMHDLVSAETCYREGLRWARSYLGDGGQVTSILRQCLSACVKERPEGKNTQKLGASKSAARVPAAQARKSPERARAPAAKPKAAPAAEQPPAEAAPETQLAEEIVVAQDPNAGHVEVDTVAEAPSRPASGKASSKAVSRAASAEGAPEAAPPAGGTTEETQPDAAAVEAEDKPDSSPAPAGDDAPKEDSPDAAQKAEENPVESKPTEDKPADDKPTEDKPAEDKSTEEKPADDKSAGEKPEEGKTAGDPAADSQAGAKPASAEGAAPAEPPAEKKGDENEAKDA